MLHIYDEKITLCIKDNKSTKDYTLFISDHDNQYSFILSEEMIDGLIKYADKIKRVDSIFRLNLKKDRD